MIALVSDSCTTGWLHWGHGELWATPHSLVRIGRRSLTMNAALRSARHGALGEIMRGRTQRIDRTYVDDAVWAAGLAREPRTVVIDLADIVEADLARGISTSRLRVHLLDGRRVKLLWMRNAAALSLVARAIGDPAAHRAALDRAASP